jgi:pimeloyl-ACP methyl ester carboxylesterase
MPTVNVNGISLYYEVSGEGEPLVLIAGLGYELWQWHRMVPLLAARHKVIAFDNRGVGRSDAPPGPYTARLLADDSAGLLAALGIEQAAVMGHSMGGFVAQELALSHPALVSKLVLASTNFGGPRHVPITPEAMAVLSDMASDPIERLRRGIAVSTAPGFAEANAAFVEEWVQFRIQHPLNPAGYQAQMMIGLSLYPEEACFEGRLKDVTAPTLILFGAHDKVVPPGNAALLAAQLPDSTVTILPDAGHFFPLETPEAAAAAVLDFLAR